MYYTITHYNTERSPLVQFMKRNSSFVSRYNYLQLVFVFAAFAIMGLAAYFFIAGILRERLYKAADDLLVTAEANIRTNLSEADTIFLSSYYAVESMVRRGAPQEEILDYLTDTSRAMLMRLRNQSLLNYYGVYGFINGEFYDGIGLHPDDTFIPQTRPWYETAVRGGNALAYTTPYKDARTGDTIISVVRAIYIDGEMAGILAMDVNLKWLSEYIGSLSLTADGYGILLNQDMAIVAHPYSNFIGRQIQELDKSYEHIAITLRSEGVVHARKGKNSDGSPIIIFFNQMFNGWYAGIATPHSQFYRDLHSSAQVLAILGGGLSLILCFILLRLSAARMRADEESKSKSSFLANMSHEIRTPMNAITGMAELLLRRDLPEDVRSEVQEIKHAGNNLISIINDILDFSKIEAGKLEIIPAVYLLSSLVNDTVNIIRMRLLEKPIRFFTNIDGNIPNGLIGDEVRIRQILLNLLSNAVKYSEKGHIGFSITVDRQEETQVWLRITVADTGRGIQPEDQARLFGDFVQFDKKKNRGVEGTGLGLAITKRLCLAMNGDIGVESEYGHGSVFTAVIPQGIESRIPFAAVEEPEHKKVLVYEGRSVYARSVCWTLVNMGIPHTLVTDLDGFSENLGREEWFYVFSGYGLYEKIKPVMERATFPGGKKPPLALLVEWGTEAFIPHVRFVSLPAQSLSIANVLNGRADSRGYTENSSVIRFSCPAARILVVDDIATNLKVAEGLLAPYKATVDICLSGRQAIEMVQHQHYDIVFMDHMMPEMDGIETTAAIRAWEAEKANGKKGVEFPQETPIVALTANAVSGMREMFIANGFSDFLAKPIDISMLDEILHHWIPKEKIQLTVNHKQKIVNNEQISTPPTPLTIPGIDSAKGIAMTGGTEALYRQVLSLFRSDAQERLPLLQTVPEASALPMFVTQVHALKSAAASVGAAAISAEAAGLEAAGKAGDLTHIRENLSAFAERLAELVKNIGAALDLSADSRNAAADTNGICSEQPHTIPLFRELAGALQSQNVPEIDRILGELSKQPMDAQTRETVEQISDAVLVAEFGKAQEILATLPTEDHP